MGGQQRHLYHQLVRALQRAVLHRRAECAGANALTCVQRITVLRGVELAYKLWFGLIAGLWCHFVMGSVCAGTRLDA